MHHYDVIAAGLMVLDLVAVPVDRHVYDVDTVYPDSMSFLTGGDMLNAAFSMRKLGARVAIAGALGSDPAGQTILSAVDALHIDHTLVTLLEDIPTPITVVLCETGGERHFIHRPGSNDYFDASQLTDEVLSSASILYIGSALALKQLEGEALAALLRRAQARGMTTVMDAASSRNGRWREKVEAALPYTDVFFPSLIEAQAITGERDPEEAAAFFRAHGVGVAGVKLGGDGCLINDHGTLIHVKAIPHDSPIDFTGAGDAFMGGFVRGMGLHYPPKKCAQLGSAVAHTCISTVGASSYACTLDEAQRKADAFYGA